MMLRFFICCAIGAMFAFRVKQDDAFYNAYKKQFPKSTYRTKKNIRYTHQYLNLFKVLTDKYQVKTGCSFFEKDTVYLICFKGTENAFLSGIIWNSTSSLSFRQINWLNAKRSPADRVFTQKMDAAGEIKSYNKGFLNAIMKADTAAYHAYADKYKVFDGESVSPVVCIRNKGTWHFIDLPGNGQNIAYDL